MLHNSKAPMLVDENMMNISRTRSPRSKPMQVHRSPRLSTPRKTSHLLRSTASVPVLRSPSAKRLLRPKGSRLDLLDNKNLTSFPSPAHEKGPGADPLQIIDDYIPVRKAQPDALFLPLVRQDEADQPQTWRQVVWRKLRWRWRLQGLIH